MKLNPTHLSRNAVLVLAGLLPTFLHADPALEAETVELDEFTVTVATRTEKSMSALPQTISVLAPEALSDQLAISSDFVSALSQAVPSYSPSRGKMTGAGETFRGRNPLFMIDGVPQSNPLRDGSRDGYTIDPAMVERVEFVHGASAAQGMGATGGIINYVTKDAPVADGLAQHAEVRFTTDDGFSSAGFGQRVAYRLGYRSGAIGAVAAVAYEWRPMSYDADGNLVGIDNTQGDTMNSHSLDLYGKITYALSGDREVRLTANQFNVRQDLEYVAVPGSRAEGIPTTSVKGATPGKATENDVTTVAVRYHDKALLGGNLTVELFHNDFAATYGGGTFATFIHHGERIFDQSENQSRKHGAKVTFAHDLDGIAGLVGGVDYLSDATRQVLVQTGREWVPETTYESWAPYLQLDRTFGTLLVTAGLRYESARLQVDDFTTLESYGSQAVAGGSPDFDETLLNAGATYRLSDYTTVFGTYSQGFGMPDVGRVLRGINEPGQDIDEYLNLAPIVTDNYEIGIRHHDRTWKGALSLFRSGSDFGSRLQANADGIFDVRRERTETWGWEANLEVDLSEQHTIGGVFAWVEGQSDTDGDNEVDTDLDGANIPPARLNLYWTARWTPALRTRLQTSTLFDNEGRDFDGYGLVDLFASYATGPGTVAVGIENLLDRQYITYYAQTVGNDSRYFAGRGRVLSVRYSIDF